MVDTDTVAIRHTRDRTPHLVFGRYGAGPTIEFARGERVAHVDRDAATWAVNSFDGIEYHRDDKAAEDDRADADDDDADGGEILPDERELIDERVEGLDDLETDDSDGNDEDADDE